MPQLLPLSTPPFQPSADRGYVGINSVAHPICCPVWVGGTRLNGSLRILVVVTETQQTGAVPGLHRQLHVWVGVKEHTLLEAACRYLCSNRQRLCFTILHSTYMNLSDPSSAVEQTRIVILNRDVHELSCHQRTSEDFGWKCNFKKTYLDIYTESSQSFKWFSKCLGSLFQMTDMTDMHACLCVRACNCCVRAWLSVVDDLNCKSVLFTVVIMLHRTFPCCFQDNTYTVLLGHFQTDCDSSHS